MCISAPRIHELSVFLWLITIRQCDFSGHVWDFLALYLCLDWSCWSDLSIVWNIRQSHHHHHHDSNNNKLQVWGRLIIYWTCLFKYIYIYNTKTVFTETFVYLCLQINFSPNGIPFFFYKVAATLYWHTAQRHGHLLINNIIQII